MTICRCINDFSNTGPIWIMTKHEINDEELCKKIFITAHNYVFNCRRMISKPHFDNEEVGPV